jgi:hypothetical protein
MCLSDQIAPSPPLLLPFTSLLLSAQRRHLLASHLSPLSSSGASGYQNRVHKKHEYLIICPYARSHTPFYQTG